MNDQRQLAHWEQESLDSVPTFNLGALLNETAPVIFEDRLQSRDFVHVSNIVQANILLESFARVRRWRL